MPPKFKRHLNDEEVTGSICSERRNLLEEDSDEEEDFFLRGPTGPRFGAGSDKIRQVQSQVDEVIDVMQENISKVIDRGERLEDLQDKSDEGHHSSGGGLSAAYHHHSSDIAVSLVSPGGGRISPLPPILLHTVLHISQGAPPSLPDPCCASLCVWLWVEVAPNYRSRISSPSPNANLVLIENTKLT
ncbi:uncharacterized protein isoform X2 [Salmo salar]|nr:uncharacterized protein LOC106613970 isoform X2 [Salmo salar]XP_045543585.1 uncharacterized protein LOC106613970 isoform X2 [Salmo salar]